MASYRRMHEESFKDPCYSPYYYCLTSPVPPPVPPPPPLPCPPPIPNPSLPQTTPPDPVTAPIKLSHNRTFSHNHVLLALTVLACVFFVSLLSTAVLVFYRRRLRRRRALAALVNTPLFNPDPPPDTGAGGDDPGPQPDQDPIHHVWYIRTVGLDEATIESIAVTQYRTGSGLLGSADCSVCLGDFQDGDLVRLLPKCGHAFHVPCIDTWLRAHINCPVCRADVVDPKVADAVADSTSASSEASAGDMGETESDARDSGEVSLDEDSRNGEENEHEEEVFDEVPLSDSLPVLPDSTVQTESEARRPSPEPVRHRSASVDSPFMVPNIVITIPEIGISDQVLKESIIGEDHSGKEKDRPSNLSKSRSTQIDRLEMVRSFSSSSGSGRGFFFSRSGRSRSSVLPL
ncbi:RING-H2 finger protein ATL52 [Rhynchospora pubera]|uniref:RING-type E3 ubiquitin transferase n=1 Tax=Rhynchospora pubera TaxID=906938 RepID=A0AAV8BPT1_9POAL|nr:RING-H2 finger protein ATL52 [Rhynchospora pubera]